MGIMGGGKSGANSALAAKPNILSSLRIQTSAYGQVIPIVYGQNRLASRLIWSGDFVAIPHTSTTKVGGKGLGSGGGNAIANTTYTYQTAIAMALCQGPIQNIHNVWDTKGKLTLISATVPFTVPGGGGSITVTPPGSGIFHSPKGVSRLDSFSFVQNDFGSDGAVTFSGNQNTPMALVGSSPGAGQYTQSGATFTFAAADTGKAMTVTYVYSVPDSNSNGQPQQKLNLTLFLGTRPQTPWSYLTSAHPGQDLGYNGIAYVAASAMDLGSSGTLPNLSFEVLGILPFGAGITDAEPSAIIADLLSNAFYGMAGTVPAGDLTQYRDFCTANGLFVSPVMDAQKAASAWIQDLLDVTNAAAVWSEGVLKIVPYGDTTSVGNGVIFFPNTTPIYDLTTSDLLTEVLIKRPSVADVMNSVSVEFSNRATDYNIDVAEDKDDAMIALYGLRKDNPKQAHQITTTTVAKFAANLIRKRNVEIRATYTFTLGWQFNLLEPMDLVTLTIPELGYNQKPVRITAMREDSTGQIQVDCEDFPWGTATPTLYPHQVGAGSNPQANADPGNISVPFIFEAPDRLSPPGEYQLIMGACPACPAPGSPNISGATNASPIKITLPAHGYKSSQTVVISGVLGNTAANGTWQITFVDPNNFTLNGSSGNGAYTSGGFGVNGDWGGCRIWISVDGTTYREIGKLYGPSRMGVITTSISTAVDPDTTTTISVDLTMSSGVLSGGVQADADNFRTLCFMDTFANELFSFQTATLTGTYKYNLGTYLRRGAFGTVLNVHGTPIQFLRLDEAAFFYQADPTLVGKTLHFKFTSFNRFGLMEQSLANAQDYTFAFNGNFNNQEFASNNATVDSVNSGGACNIQAYLSPTVGSAYLAFKPDGTSKSIPGQTIAVDASGTALAFSTQYFITYSPLRATHRAYQFYSDYIAAAANGEIRVAVMTTKSAGGTGGTTGGGRQFGGTTTKGGTLEGSVV